MDKENKENKEVEERGRPEYGFYEENFYVIAKLQQIYNESVNSRSHEFNALELAHDFAICQVLVKIGRIATGGYNKDNYVDIIGYIKLAKKLGDSVGRQPTKGETHG